MESTKHPQHLAMEISLIQLPALFCFKYKDFIRPSAIQVEWN